MFNNKDFDYIEFKRLYNASKYEPEFYVLFEDKEDEYMITKYSNFVDFLRCGGVEKHCEILSFSTLDELYEADLMDGINLKRDWYKIKEISPNGYNFFEVYCECNNIEYKGELCRE